MIQIKYIKYVHFYFTVENNLYQVCIAYLIIIKIMYQQEKRYNYGL